MDSEYVRLSNPERIYGAKTLLQSQVSTLQLMKHFKQFEHLRKDELALKIELKTKIEHTLQLVDSLIRSLPKTSFGETEIVEKGFSEFQDKEEKKSNSLEQELDEIKRKLETLG